MDFLLEEEEISFICLLLIGFYTDHKDDIEHYANIVPQILGTPHVRHICRTCVAQLFSHEGGSPCPWPAHETSEFSH